MLVRDLGLMEYGKALRIQEAIRDELISGSGKETLLVCEHPQVITVGRALGSRDEVFGKTIPIFEVSRGGRSTLHLPGQVVVYPILNLATRGKDLHAYMRLLEDSITNTCSDFRVEAGRVEGKTGVWIDNERKIASLGVAVKKWVSYHGVALNVICDLSVFSNISPCGFESKVMTSLEKELSETYRKTWRVRSQVLFKDVKNRLVENMLEVFN
jgi:lipoate-protein ligase B